MAAPTDLQTRAAPAGKLRLSDSLETSKDGEFMLLSNQGEVLSPWGRRWFRLRIGVGTAAVVAVVVPLLGTVLPESLLFPALLLGYVVGIPWLFLQSRTLRRGMLLVQDQRNVEALEYLQGLDTRWMAPSQRAALAQMASVAAVRLGRWEDVLQATEMVAGPPTGRKAQRANQVLLRLGRIHALTELRRLDDAQRALDALGDAPKGQYFRLARFSAELHLAFARGAVRSFTGDPHDVASMVLKSNRFGSTAALVAWAFEQQGDLEMAQHMLTEAFPRVGHADISKTNPALHAWMQQRAAAWGISNA